MNATKTLAFIKEWRQFTAERKSLDYREARWAHNLRAEYPDGDAGDRSFYLWLDAELGMPPREREAMLDKARAFGVVPDQATWDAQGAKQLRQIVRVTPKERVAILGAAKAEGKKIGDVIRARDRTQAARSAMPIRDRAQGTNTSQSDAVSIKRWACQLSAEALADALAEQIADGILAAPLHVVAAAKRRAVVLRRANGRKAA